MVIPSEARNLLLPFLSSSTWSEIHLAVISDILNRGSRVFVAESSHAQDDHVGILCYDDFSESTD